MTLYSTEFMTSPGDMNGNQTTTITQNIHNSNKFFSSEEAPIEGPTVIDGQTGRVKGVTDVYDLADNDRIVVEGIPMTIQQARELGIALDLDAPRASPQGQRVVSPRGKQEAKAVEVEVGPQPGDATDEERTVGSTMADAFMLHTGMSADNVAEMGEDIALGLERDDELWGALAAKGISRDAAMGAVDNATQTAEGAARRELGDKDYSELETYAQRHEGVRKMVISNGMKRIMGKRAVPWTDVLALARQHSRR